VRINFVLVALGVLALAAGTLLDPAAGLAATGGAVLVVGVLRDDGKADG